MAARTHYTMLLSSLIYFLLLGQALAIIASPNFFEATHRSTDRLANRRRQTGPGIPGGAGGPDLVINPLLTTKGQFTHLVVLVRWADHVNRVLPGEPELNVVFNRQGPHPTYAAAGSVRDYFLKNSYNQLTVDTIFTDWITVNVTESSAAQGVSGMNTCCALEDALLGALAQADRAIDFTALDSDNNGFVDAITFVHSGYGAEFGGVDIASKWAKDRIWSRVTELSKGIVTAEGIQVRDIMVASVFFGTGGTVPARPAVFSYAIANMYGLPNMYGNKTQPANTGLGAFCLMAISWGFDWSQMYPPMLSAWPRIKLNWITPTTIMASGVYTARSVIDYPDVFKITYGFPDGEFLLIENRQPKGFDALIPQGGLAIYHVDERARDDTEGYPGQPGWPFNGRHYRVSLLQADGQYSLESTTSIGDAGDLWRAGSTATLSPYTVPNTDTYQYGVVHQSGVYITVLDAPGDSMRFTVSLVAPITTTSSTTSTATSTSTSTSTSSFTPTPSTTTTTTTTTSSSKSTTASPPTGSLTLNPTPTSSSRTTTITPSPGPTPTPNANSKLAIDTYSVTQSAWPVTSPTKARAIATIRIVDSSLAARPAIPGVTVKITFTVLGKAYSAYSNTDSTGVVRFTSPTTWTKSASTKAKLCITGVSKTGYIAATVSASTCKSG